MYKTIRNIEDLPKGYFRIHWPQSQMLMDVPGYDEDVMHCVDAAAIDELPTVALPYRWMDVVEKELGGKTRFYIEFINQNPDLN